MQKILGFLRAVQAELTKVNWPTREEIVRYTVMVVIISAAVAAFLGTLDYFFSYLVETYLLTP